MSSEFGQKDHFIALALAPFVLAQLSLNADLARKQRIISIAVLVFFTPFILIKPHYGLIPCVAIAYRFYEQRTLKSIFREDFFILAIGVLSYIAIIFMYFRDFVDIVLPLSLELYVTSAGAAYKPALTIGSIVFSLCLTVMALCAEKTTRDEKKLCLVFSVMTGLCIIPYWVQEKGFALHFLPVALSVTVAIFSITWLYLRDLPRHKPELALVGFLLVILITAIAYQRPEDRTHAHFIDSSMLEDFGINENTRSLFIENNSTNVSQTLTAYNGLQHASRLSANWFTMGQAWFIEEDKRNQIFDQLGNYVAEDLNRYKPEIIVLINDERFPSYLVAFAKHENFQNELSHYSAIKDYETDKILYYMTKEQQDLLNDVRYKIYKRNIDDANQARE